MTAITSALFGIKCIEADPTKVIYSSRDGFEMVGPNTMTNSTKVIKC